MNAPKEISAQKVPLCLCLAKPEHSAILRVANLKVTVFHARLGVIAFVDLSTQHLAKQGFFVLVPRTASRDLLRSVHGIAPVAFTAPNRLLLPSCARPDFFALLEAKSKSNAHCLHTVLPGSQIILCVLLVRHQCYTIYPTPLGIQDLWI